MNQSKQQLGLKDNELDADLLIWTSWTEIGPTFTLDTDTRPKLGRWSSQRFTNKQVTSLSLLFMKTGILKIAHRKI